MCARPFSSPIVQQSNRNDEIWNPAKQAITQWTALKKNCYNSKRGYFVVCFLTKKCMGANDWVLAHVYCEFDFVDVTRLDFLKPSSLLKCKHIELLHAWCRSNIERDAIQTLLDFHWLSEFKYSFGSLAYTNEKMTANQSEILCGDLFKHYQLINFCDCGKWNLPLYARFKARSPSWQNFMLYNCFLKNICCNM